MSGFGSSNGLVSRVGWGVVDLELLTVTASLYVVLYEHVHPGPPVVEFHRVICFQFAQ